ncbi:MAG: thermonuclease family protein, partial [Acetobacteraceae bacterium]|nr:thermonuclease family protein [Acetobacteraceae bacterium]
MRPLPRVVTPDTAWTPPPGATTPASRISSTSVRIVDGDSLELGAQRIRLDGIDALELSQTCRDARGGTIPCGRRARDALEALVRGGRVDCVGAATDRYGRLLARCMTARGIEINRTLVREGWALAYPGDATYAAEERAAAAERRGIHAWQFVRPEAWRRG